MKKCLRKLTCLLLCAGMIPSATLTAFAEQTTPDYSVLMKEDFSQGKYKNKSRWASGTTEIVRQVDGDFALKVTKGNSVLIRFPKVIKSGKLTIDFDFYTSDIFSNSTRLGVNLSDGRRANMMWLQGIDENGDSVADTSRVRTGNYGDFIRPFESKKWYRLRVVLNIDENSCVLKYGEKESTPIYFDNITNATPTHLSNGIHEIELDNALKNNAFYLIDNLAVYEGEAPALQLPQASEIGFDNYAISNSDGNFKGEMRLTPPEGNNYNIISALKNEDGTIFDIEFITPDSIINHSANVNKENRYTHELFLLDKTTLAPFVQKHSAEILPKNEATAKELLSEIDFVSHPELSAVKILFDEGKYTQAIQKYKSIFFTRMKKHYDDGKLVSTVGGNASAGKKLYEENRATIFFTDGKNHVLDFGTPGSYYWWEETQYSNLLMTFMNDLMKAYLTYGDIKYFDRWTVMWEDFQKHFVASAPTAEDKKKACEILRKGLGVAPITERSLGDLYHALAKDYDSVVNSISNDEFISLMRLWQQASTDCTVLISTPNQCISAITNVCMLYPAVSDFVWGKDNLDRALSRLDVYMAANYLPDGQDAEMSFNYNYGLIRNSMKIKNSLSDYNLVPDYDFQNIAKTRLRSMSALLTPQGKLPNIGKTYDSYNQNSYIKEYSGIVGGEELADTIRAHTFDGAEAVPAFNSIAFPYAGYYALRDGWDSDSSYAFFRSGRHNIGHSDYQCLQLMLSAFGERLLIAAGPTAYSKLDIDDYLTSSFAGNTVTVDGYSQVFNSKTDSEDMHSVIPARFHDGGWIAYTEGEYDNGYGIINNADLTAQKKTVTGIRHARKLITDFENGIYVTADTLNQSGMNEHEYTLNWNLAYKFNDLSYADITENGFSTNNNVAGAGIEIQTFADSDINYSKYCGYSAPEDENTGDERSYKGWYLQNYGTDYKPSLHIEGTWKTTSISSEALSLIVPKNGASPVQSLQKIGKNGFVATLTNGRSVYCSADDFELDSIYAGGGFFYIVKDGNNYKGIAIDAQTLAIGNTLIGTGSFEFDFVNGVVTTKSITIPAGFKWTKTNAGYIPEYK